MSNFIRTLFPRIGARGRASSVINILSFRETPDESNNICINVYLNILFIYKNIRKCSSYIGG